MSFNDFYAGKKVFLTGHTGFKGAWLACWLTQLGAEVTGFSLEAPSAPSLFDAMGLADKIHHVSGDIRDFAAVTEAMRAAQPDVVFHLAAQALVLPSYESPKDTVDTNVGGTVNVLEAVRTTESVRVLVSVTSDKCYENREQIWGYRENDAFGGKDPYSASKGAMEIICSSWNRSFFQPEGRVAAATVRAGNVIGGGDFGKERLVPDTIRALMQGKALEVRRPESVRPWQFVLEPLSGYLWLGARLGADAERFSGGWNFAPADGACTVRELADMLIESAGTGGWKDVSEGATSLPPEAGLLRLCSDKARTMLDWSAVLTVREAVAVTVEGYRPFLDGRENAAWDSCSAQIAEYTETARNRGAAWAE